MVIPGLSGNGNVSLRGGSQSYTATNGVVQVQPVDVPIALASGWTLHGGSAAAFAAAQVHQMAPPATGPANGATVTFPDATTAVITAGVLLVPAQWVAWMQGQHYTLIGAVAGA